MHYRELFTRRLVIGDINPGHPRAILEANGAGVKITLQGDRRHPPLLLEAPLERAPRIVIGDPERGPSIELEREGVLVWMDGNVVATIRAREEGGAMDLCDPQGVPVVRLPGKWA